MAAPGASESGQVITEARRLLAAGRTPEAFRLLKTALATLPTDVNLLLEMAAVYRMIGSLTEAEGLYKRVLNIQPSSIAALNNLAVIAGDMGQAASAASLFERALASEPANISVHNNYLSNAQYVPGVTAASLLPLHQAWDERHAMPLRQAWQPPPTQRVQEKKLKLGFLSADFTHHPVAYFMLPLFRALDRNACEIHCIQHGSRQDHLTPLFKSSTDAWHTLSDQSDAEAVSQIRNAGIDILFDMAGHSMNNRLGVFARKAAPLQITWAGYVGTTGLDAMDYILADAHQIPDNEDDAYAEKIIRMPECYVPYLPPETAPSIGALPVLKNKYVTFGGFHNPAKLNDSVLALWAKILGVVKNSRLILRYRGLDAPANRERILSAFVAQGVSADRIDTGGATPHPDLLAAYNLMDIALDPLPYSGGVTTCEALWMGVPVVTLTGQSFAGRHAASYLATVGLSELIADTPERYVAIASNLAAALDKLNVLRQGMRARMLSSPLMNYEAYARDFLAAMRHIWAGYCDGVAPKSFSVRP